MMLRLPKPHVAACGGATRAAAAALESRYRRVTE